jgi:carboxyl-terminal processing protease
LELRPVKTIFLQSDIDEFSKYETELDDQLIKDLTFQLSYDRLKRMEERAYEEIMNVPFDYSIDESFNYDKAPYKKNTAELTERWRKQIKLSALSSLDGAFESSRKQNKSLEGQSEKDTLDALKSAKVDG